MALSYPINRVRSLSYVLYFILKSTPTSMAKSIFNSENSMQQWLSNQLADKESLSDMIINAEEIKQLQDVSNMAQAKVLESYKYCLESFDVVFVLMENRNISLKQGDVLKPDFLLYAPETESIIIIEVKHLVSPSRQAGTEVSAYANEIRSYIPFIADGDMINVVISSVWPTLLTHFVFHEIFWLQRNIICLQPTKTGQEIKLEIVDLATIAQDDITVKLSPRHLGGYRICLYDDELYFGSTRDRLDKYILQMKTAIVAMATKGNAHKNNGFAFLWKDNHPQSLAPYNITIMNFAPFNSLERLFHDPSFKPNEMTEKFIEVIQEHSPEGHGFSLQAISKYGERFLEDICSIRPEGFYTWEVHRDNMTKASELLAFVGWGILGELYTDKLLNKYKEGIYTIQPDDPFLGLELIDGLVDLNYDFYELNGYSDDQDDEQENED
jgi:hypothetical protein